MQKKVLSRSGHRAAASKVLAGLNDDPAFAAIVAPEIRGRMRLAQVVERFRRFNQDAFGLPFGECCLRAWLQQWPGADQVERFGLPRHNVERLLGPDALTLWVRPRDLVQDANVVWNRKVRRPSSMALVWDGDWDLWRDDLRVGATNELAKIRDLVAHRDRLQDSQSCRRLMRQLRAGRPYRSHREGIYLNSLPRILNFLEVYLGFLDNMAANGYQPERAVDAIGVVISREGSILKYRRGRHRLAMAQWLDLPEIPVRVTHVHRSWWDRITQGVTGRDALDRLCEALPQCKPEQKPGLRGAPDQTAPSYVQWPEKTGSAS